MQLFSKCPNLSCELIIRKKECPSFLELSLEDQIKKISEKPSFYQHLQHRFNWNKKKGCIEDIYDGKLYKDKVTSNGVLSHPENIPYSGIPMESQCLNPQIILFGRCILLSMKLSRIVYSGGFGLAIVSLTCSSF